MSARLERLGHLRLADGSILRLDFELGAYVASWYRSDLSMQACAYGTFEDMRALVGVWADKYEASLTPRLSVSVDGFGSGAAIPAPDQTKLLGEAV